MVEETYSYNEIERLVISNTNTLKGLIKGNTDKITAVESRFAEVEELKQKVEGLVGLEAGIMDQIDHKNNELMANIPQNTASIEDVTKAVKLVDDVVRDMDKLRIFVKSKIDEVNDRIDSFNDSIRKMNDRITQEVVSMSLVSDNKARLDKNKEARKKELKKSLSSGIKGEEYNNARKELAELEGS